MINKEKEYQDKIMEMEKYRQQKDIDFEDLSNSKKKLTTELDSLKCEKRDLFMQ